MRNLGQGYTGIQKFSTFMNMPSPMTVKNFDHSVRSITKATVKVAEQSMSKAVAEITKGSQDVTDIGVSCDGTLQRRGFSSLNECYTAISLDTGKVLDTEVMSRYCKSCKINEPLKKQTQRNSRNGLIVTVRIILVN